MPVLSTCPCQHGPCCLCHGSADQRVTTGISADSRYLCVAKCVGWVAVVRRGRQGPRRVQQPRLRTGALREPQSGRGGCLPLGRPGESSLCAPPVPSQHHAPALAPGTARLSPHLIFFFLFPALPPWLLQVLLCKRAIDPCKGLWGFPQGQHHCSESGPSEHCPSQPLPLAGTALRLASPFTCCLCAPLPLPVRSGLTACGCSLVGAGAGCTQGFWRWARVRARARRGRPWRRRGRTSRPQTSWLSTTSPTRYSIHT